jgi:hypothetical protein
VIAGRNSGTSLRRWIWGLAFGLVALYVAVRMGVFALWAEVVTPDGTTHLPNTFASVDHPFHVARAEVLWRELASGNLLRWIAQHQGGYPVEFYPLGEAWLEVAVRALALGTLPAEGAHTLTIVALFLAPGAAFAALAHQDGWSPAVGLIAFVLHISLPGGWYDGGYTELVQWGLVTNVAGAVAAFCMLPAVVSFLRTGGGWVGSGAAALGALAIYCNPRSLLALAALGLGAWLAGIFRAAGSSIHGAAADVGDSSGRDGVARTTLVWHLQPRTTDSSRVQAAPAIGVLTMRLALVAVLTGLLAAPQLMALARFRDLYTFVQYSGYTELAAYAVTAANAITRPVLVLGLLGLIMGLLSRQRQATASSAAALLLYLALTATLVLFPAAANLAPQLETTRLMPLQRLLTLYLAAVAFWIFLSWVISRIGPSRRWLVPMLGVGTAATILLIQTRSLGDLSLDPASPVIPPVSLYSVAMSARPEQADLETAIRVADEAATPGTALLVVGSALSWHQQLWAPLWTERPLFYDNWLWYWHPDHRGTPGYAFLAGHHYPDPERTLERDYLARHGLGAVVVTGPTREVAATSPLLRPLREGVYEVYAVIDPVTMVTFGDQNAASLEFGNRRIAALSDSSGAPVTARVNWHPRWEATVESERAEADRLHDGYIGIARSEPVSRAELVYSVQPLDWAARVFSLIGLVGLAGLVVRNGGKDSWKGTRILSRLAGRVGSHVTGVGK